MSRFLQLHLLTSYPPANLNRDDLGRPKTAKMGGFDRLRVSSQSLKRAWRTSDIFESAIEKGVRTKMIGAYALEKLADFPTLSRTEREQIAKNIALAFGKLKSNSVELETLAFISNTERIRIDNIINSFRKGFSDATEESNSLGVKLFSVLSSEIRTSVTHLIDLLKDEKSNAKLINDWSKKLKENIKNYKTAADKGYDFLGKMIEKQSEWLDSMVGDTEVRDDQLELVLAEEYAKLTKDILKKLSLGDLLSGKNAKETIYGEVKHKEHVQLCKGWEEQIEPWINEVKNSEEEFTSEEHIRNLKQAVSPVAIPKSSILTNEHMDADIALFGRMLADSPKHNVEAACQVAHAISVHTVAIEDDYFTAVEEMNKYRHDVGAAHLDEASFAAGLFYSYICINKELLIKNLINDFSEDIDISDTKYDVEQKLAAKAICALIEAAVKVSPQGKQNSYGSRAYANYVLAEKGNQQPRSLSVAFLKPIIGDDYGTNAVEALTSQLNHMDKVYGPCADARFYINALDGSGGTYHVPEVRSKEEAASTPNNETIKADEKGNGTLFEQLLLFVSE